MATLTAGELTNLRTTKHSSKFYLSVLQPTTLLTARVNNGSISRGDRSIAYDTGSGTYASIEAGQTLWVGTSAGDNDVGRIRVKSITGSATSGTITIDENGIDWIDNLHLTILHHYEIWPIPPRIDSGIFYKFYDTTYSNQNSLPNPVAIAGPHQAGFLASGSLILNVPVADSYVVTSGATISTKVVSVSPSAGVTVGAEAGGVIPITYTAAGTYWVKNLVTDSNGKQQGTYRVHFVYDTTTLPYRDFDISGLGGDWNSAGWQFSTSVYGDVTLSDFPDGTIVLLWREGRHDDTETYVNIWTIGDNIVCSGYIRRDSQSDDLSTGVGQVSFTVETPNGVLANRSEMGTVSIEAQTSPGTWYQYASWLTAGRAVHHLLLWHSTTMHTVDVYGLLDNTLGVEVAEFSEDSILSRVNGFGFNRGVFARMVSDRLGRFHFSEDIQMFNETDRAAEDTIFTLNENDLSGDVNISRESEEQAALSFIDGFSFDGSTATVLISIAGGYIDASAVSIQVPEPAGSGSINRTRQILNDQTDSNEKCGRLLAAGNNRLKEIRVPMRGDYLGAYDIDPQNGWVNWGVANATLKRQLSLNGSLLLPRRVQHDLSVVEGTINSSVIFEAEAFGPDGIPGNYPTSYPAPTLPTPNWTEPVTGGDFGYIAGGLTSALGIVVTADRITFSTGVTAANTDSNLSGTRRDTGALSDTVTYGYWAGGSTSATTVETAIADRITFSTGVTAANTDSNLSLAREAPAALSDGATYGYFLGGNPTGAGSTATADRITFSTGVTAANTDSNLSGARVSPAGLSDDTTYGYIGGGESASQLATTDRITFSTGMTVANTDSDLSQARTNLVGLSDITTYGYWAGGRTGFTSVATADRITFSTGVTAANTDSDLSQIRKRVAGMGDGATYGYFFGGSTSNSGSAQVVTADRITFSTGVTAANTDSDLSGVREAASGLSDGSV